jgi:hypothetical protein
MPSPKSALDIGEERAYILAVGCRIVQREEKIMPAKKPSTRTKRLTRTKKLEAKKPLALIKPLSRV